MLTIAKCIKICMYYGKDFVLASEMRRHIYIGLKYAKRNLKVNYRVARNTYELG